MECGVSGQRVIRTDSSTFVEQAIIWILSSRDGRFKFGTENLFPVSTSASRPFFSKFFKGLNAKTDPSCDLT